MNSILDIVPEMPIATVSSGMLHDSVSRLAPLIPYIAEVGTLGQTDETNAPKKLETLSKGLFKVSDVVAQLTGEYAMAENDLRVAEACAALDGFPEYCEKKSLKGTEEMRKHFVRKDPTVVAASQRVAISQAALEQAKTYRTAITMALASVRSIAYGYRSSDSV